MLINGNNGPFATAAPTFLTTTINPGLIALISYFYHCNNPTKQFYFLFSFRYLRLVVNLIGFWVYKPTPVPSDPILTSRDVTVIVPTVDPSNVDFAECIRSLAANHPASIIIVTAGGYQNFAEASTYQDLLPHSTITVLASDQANKRNQVVQGLTRANTPITVLCDDHVFWPPSFLRSLLAPFETLSIGAVGTSKRVRRAPGPPGTFSWRSFWNLMAILYLERNNFIMRATNAIDGGVSTISGRTAAYRTSILRNPAFINSFLNEYTFFGFAGPLNADDDKFLTRWVVDKGWGIKMQCTEDATIETTLGTYPKFLAQCVRWARTSWRSNTVSIFVEGNVWRRYPWCVYAIYITSFINFALFYDAAMGMSLYHALDTAGAKKAWILVLVAWILVTKMVKVMPYFWKEPKDLVLVPGYIVFGYAHSFIKLYALLTFWDISWAGRKGLGRKVE